MPLQRGARQQGNTVFLDDHLRPYPDAQQWACLAAVTTIDRATVEAIAAEAVRRGAVVGVRSAETADDDDAAPWTRPPSGRLPAVPITGPLPARIRAVLSQRLFIEKVALPSPLLNQIKRLAAFQNPEFFKKQRMRLSTARTPRVIACAEDLPQHIALPRGCHDDLAALLREHGVVFEVEDRREHGQSLDLHFTGTLTEAQHAAAQAQTRWGLAARHRAGHA